MILQQLTVRNFCVFAGEQVFDLTPGRRHGKHLPLVLFGGINGGGKTTLRDAIQLALYGPGARCSKRSQLSYDDFLRASVHHGMAATEAAGVALSFRYAVDGTERLYDVARSWRVSQDRVREELRVFVDGLPDAWLADNWSQMVEELFPLEISQLFFFDAEKIRALAEDESSSKALGAAIKALLGLDIVERLIADSAVVQTRLAKKTGSPQRQTEVVALEQRFRDEHRQLDELRAQRASLENRRLRADTAAREAKDAFAAGGGKVWQAREEYIRRHGEAKREEEEIARQLVDLAAGSLPLVLVGNLLDGALEQHQHERAAAEAEVVQQLLQERDQALLAVLAAGRAPAGLVRRVAEHLEADRRSREPASVVPRRLALTPEAADLLRQLSGSKLTELRAEAVRLLEQFATVGRQRADLDESLAAVPAEADIAALAERFTTATQEHTLLEEQARQLKEAFEAQQRKFEEAKADLDKVVQGQLDEEFAHEDVRRMLELAGRTRTTMQLFLGRVTERKIDRLARLITECFRFLARKQTLVEQVHIDPATFAITLHNSAGQAVARERLSEGEKQIFAIAVLWGLARACARPLPAVIDTPMARLDAAHRQHLVERYFPNASHQVVIFSTDTEVDRQYYQALGPCIARAYHLVYDEQHRRTIGEEGYFWKEEQQPVEKGV
jgi:DNA sulfur modification protein DndD